MLFCVKYTKKIVSLQKQRGNIMRDTQKTIKTLRVSAGITQQELANATGMQQQNIARIEKAETGVSLDNFEKILATLHHHLEIVPDAVSGC